MTGTSGASDASRNEGTVTTMEKTTTKRRILVIDKNDESRSALCDQLSALGFDVVVEDNGVSGLLRMTHDWKTAPFHGLFVELHMEVLGGMAVLLEVGERFPSVPVIVMSDSSQIGKLRQAIKLGAKEYVLKPFDRELVRRKCLSVFF